MRYWGYLAAKLAAAGGTMYELLRALNAWWPQPHPFLNVVRVPRFGYDLPYTCAAGLWFLLCCGALFLCIYDQRYRCRVCLRRLRMPIGTGSWGRMLQLGRPCIEYICPYGHGKLNIDALQISGLANPEWTPHADMWEELEAVSKGQDRER